MSRNSYDGQAIELLTEHLERVEQLRNARARDSAFKQWRQSTLTTLQRLWPDDTTKADRFRRIPFTHASPKASERAMRDAHDAGCREVRKLLKLWIAEIELKGLEESTEAKPARAKKMPAKSASKTPRAPAKAAVPKPKPKKQTLKSMLDLDGLPESGDGSEVSAMDEAPKLQKQAVAAPVARALSALVYELPRLGIPEENQEFLRGALLDIANRLEFEDLKWATLQELVFLTMQHPAIGRRILPLIVPYLDKAA